MARPILAKPLMRHVLYALWKCPEYGGHVSIFTVQNYQPTILSEYMPYECFQATEQ